MEPLYVVAFLLAILVLLSGVRAVVGISDFLLRRRSRRRSLARLVARSSDAGVAARDLAWSGRGSDKRGLA